MQVASTSRKLSRVLKGYSILIKPETFLLSPSIENLQQAQWQIQRSFSSQIFNLSGSTHRTGLVDDKANSQHLGYHFVMQRASFSSETTSGDGGPTEAVKEVYDKMAKSVEGRTMPPNAWMWSLIQNCANHEDIALLFKILQSLRIFRLSNLRIHSNFNSHLCQKVTEACARVGAIDFGKKTLWERNVYGLTPSVSSAHHLLLYAKEHNDTKLMVDIMKLVKKNHLPLQPGTADIIFSICYNADNWELLSKYAKKFTKAGVKLRRTTFGTWMEFAAKRGDVESLWTIEKQRSELTGRHCLATAFACAKGFILERKPESAIAVIHVLHENLPEEKRSGIMVELEKLVSEWPLQVIKHRKEDRKELASWLKTDITGMVSGLLNMGVEAKVNLDHLTIKEEAIPC